jgi:hypothetical protein
VGVLSSSPLPTVYACFSDLNLEASAVPFDCMNIFRTLNTAGRGGSSSEVPLFFCISQQNHKYSDLLFHERCSMVDVPSSSFSWSALLPTVLLEVLSLFGVSLESPESSCCLTTVLGAYHLQQMTKLRKEKNRTIISFDGNVFIISVA